MDQSLCKLTLVCPPAGADRLIELMLTMDPPIAGFNMWSAEGHGFGFANATVGERVRGHVKRSIIMAVLPRVVAGLLLNRIAEQAPIPHLTQWIEPVDSFGQMKMAKGLNRLVATDDMSSDEPR